jgi:putative zinc finger protein
MNAPRDEHPRDLLSAYLDGEVDRDVRSSIDQHLSGCASCRALLEDFRSVAAAAARETPPPVPGYLRERIRRALDSESVPRRAALAAWFGPYRLGLAAAAAVVLVIGLWALRQGPPPPVGVPEPPSSPGESAREQGKESSPLAARAEDPSRAQTPSKMMRSGGEESLERTAPIPFPEKQEDKSAPDSRLRAAQAPPTAGTPGSRGVIAPLAAPADELKSPETASRDRPGPAAASAPAAPVEIMPGVLPSDTDVMEDATVRKDGEAPSSFRLGAAASGSRLLVEYPAYTVSVFGDGTVALSSKEYSCAARRAGERPDPDLEALFTLARSGRGEATGGREEEVAAAPAVRLVESGAAGGGTGNAAAEPSVPPVAAAEIQARLRMLLRDRYLALLQSRCGPAPRSVREP